MTIFDLYRTQVKKLLKLFYLEATGISPLTLNSLVGAVCSMLNNEWEDWESRARLLSQSCKVRVGVVFMSRGRPSLQFLLLYNEFCCESTLLIIA